MLRYPNYLQIRVNVRSGDVSFEAHMVVEGLPFSFKRDSVLPGVALVSRYRCVPEQERQNGIDGHHDGVDQACKNNDQNTSHGKHGER